MSAVERTRPNAPADHHSKPVVQRRFGMRVELVIGDQQLRYAIHDSSGGREFFIPYETMALTDLPNVTLSNLPFYRRLALLPLALFVGAIATMNHVALSEDLALVSILCFAAVIAAKLLNLFSVSFTLLPANPAPQGSQGHLARIIRDSSHDHILADLKQSWSARLRQLHGAINPANEPAQELAKFKWLRDKGIITAEEFGAAAAGLDLPDDSASDARRAVN